MAEIKITGLEGILKKVESLGDLKLVVPALKAGALHIKGKTAIYPPASEANVPMQRRWYERGYGSKWMTKSGDVHGSKTSENLGRKWTISSLNAGLTQVVGNNVSYGPFVQDADEQAKFHQSRGWKTIQDVADEEAGVVLEFLQSEINKVLEG